MNQIIESLPAHEYHQRELGVVSKSALDQINRTPAHYRAWVDGEVRKDTAAMGFGRALHCAIFEPDDFSFRFAVEPDFGDCRKTDNKKRRDEWRAGNVGKTLVSPDDMWRLQSMQSSVFKHELAKRMLSGGLGEVTISWVDPETGLKSKSRADYWVKRRSLVADLKSTEDASPDGFKRSVAKYRYFVQDALYRAGFHANNAPVDYFMFIAAEKEPPFLSAIYTLDSEGIARGHASARRNIATMAECVEKNEWPGYPVGIQTLDLPPWAD